MSLSTVVQFQERKGSVILSHFLHLSKLYLFVMMREKQIVKERTARETSEDFVRTLKKYFAVLIALILLIGMFGGFVVLYT